MFLDQGSFNEILSQLFGIETGFAGSILSNRAKVNFKSVTEEVNDKHLKPWSDLCKVSASTSARKLANEMLGRRNFEYPTHTILGPRVIVQQLPMCGGICHRGNRFCLRRPQGLFPVIATNAVLLMGYLARGNSYSRTNRLFCLSKALPSPLNKERTRINNKNALYVLSQIGPLYFIQAC